MKTWKQLEQIAARDRLTIYRSHGGATLYEGDRFRSPIISVTDGNALDDDDSDRVVRSAIEAALQALRGIDR